MQQYNIQSALQVNPTKTSFNTTANKHSISLIKQKQSLLSLQNDSSHTQLK